MKLALLREVFPHIALADQELAKKEKEEFYRYLDKAKKKGADMVVLPEIAFNEWVPALNEKHPRPQDAEPSHEGPRFRFLQQAAKEKDLWIFSGAIVMDKQTHKRYNEGWIFDKHGKLVSSYRKLHLPHDPGFQENVHYDEGDDAPPEFDCHKCRTIPLICSDLMRPFDAMLLRPHLILNCRADDAEKAWQWKVVAQATSLIGACYVVSVPRPRPEFDEPLGGPTFAFGPDGKLLLETEETLTVLDVDPLHAKKVHHDGYPGYLTFRYDVYQSVLDNAKKTFNGGKYRHKEGSKVGPSSPDDGHLGDAQVQREPPQKKTKHEVTPQCHEAADAAKAE